MSNTTTPLIPAQEQPPAKEFYGWEAFGQESAELAQQVAAYNQGAEAGGYAPVDAVVVLARGGLAVGQVVSNELGLKADEVANLSVTTYEDDQQTGEIIWGQTPAAEWLNGKHVLVVDDVCDTGETLQAVDERLRHLGAASVLSAVLHYKPEKTKTGYVPRFYVRQTNSWIVYPWE